MHKSLFFLLLAGSIFGGCKDKTLFESIDPDHSGIHFNNVIQDNDSLNVLDIENIYNGGGVGLADFNNDGLQDIYFAANTVSNKLYLNKGDFRFEDITEAAGVDGKGRWSRGVSVVDINNDGLMDVYVCTSIVTNAAQRENILYINQGVNKEGIPSFRDMAVEYGLNDTSHTTMAAFFDFDNDNDLDVFLLVNQIIKNEYPNTFRPILKNGEHPSTSKLLMNEWSDSKKHPVFTDVSKGAGVTIEGYGHGVTIADVNLDGWKDIYVTNDFLSNNILYINNRNGTFTDKVFSYFKHTAANAMGQDVQDMNNDGLLDIVELDMLPEDNYRKKMMMSSNSYQTYLNSDHYGYQYQYVRNTLQVNMGPRVGAHDSIGDPTFSDIAYYSGIAETDWSWAPLVSDFDNDGYRDIIITNGFPKDVTDHDFITFRNKASLIASKRELLDQIPQVKLRNYAFRNNGDLTFTNVSTLWNTGNVSFSNGASFADLDNDGDIDYVVNNINDNAFLFRNNSKGSNTNHYLKVILKGDGLNKNGIGAWVNIYYAKGKMQVYENTPYRGYLSSIEPFAHFGIGNVTDIDSVVIKWPNGLKQVLKNVIPDKTITASIGDAKIRYTWEEPAIAAHTVLTEISDSLEIGFVHQEDDFVDFNIQKLLPHKFSEYGPALAVGDIDGNGLDDIVTSGSVSYSPVILFQQQDGMFASEKLLKTADRQSKNWEESGLLLFDADGDGDLDLYTASGGYESKAGAVSYADRFYINDGKGNLKADTLAIPKNFTSKSCVRSADYDKDGDLDLFVAGRVLPWQYPRPVSSFIYRNDTEKGRVKFTDVSNTVAEKLDSIGLVSDAIWTDFDNDNWVDLILAGEWMPVTFLKNENGIFKDITSQTGVAGEYGWWSSIAPGDFDNDGDMDYVIGNLGLNSLYRANKEQPVKMVAKDFDKNGSYDAIPAMYFPASHADSGKKMFPIHTRDDLVKQMIGFRSKYQNYDLHAKASFEELFTKEEMDQALQFQANQFQHAFFKNLGNGKFELDPLPNIAQFSCLNGMITDDFDGDGNLDLLVNGNDYGTEVSIGRYDACNGLFLQGNGAGGFVPLSIVKSGLYLPGNGKSFVKLINNSGRVLVAASQNRGPLKVFRNNKQSKLLRFEPDDVAVRLTLKNGKIRKYEPSFGASFLSQSGRFLILSNDISNIEIMKSNGNKRNVQP